MNVVVTGGSGQLGTEVLWRLAQCRKVKRVLSLDRRPPSVASAKLEWRIADVRDRDFGKHLEGATALVHMAFIVTQGAARSLMEDVNVEGTKNVVNAALAANVGTLVYSSSAAAYGIVPGHPQPIVETTPRRRTPDMPYAENKYDVEAWLDEVEAAHSELRIVRLRPVVLVGTRMEHAMGRMLARRVVPVIDSVPMPIVWDGDVADAVVLALLGQVRGAFNLSADDALTAAELARAGGMRAVRVPRVAARAVALAASVSKRLGRQPEVDPSWLRAAGVPLELSSERARTELGWKPTCPTAADVVRRFAELTPGRMDRRIRLFFGGAQRAVRYAPRDRGDAAHMTLTAHLQLTGPGGGDITVGIDAGRPRVAFGTPRPPDTVISLSARTFLDLLAGKTDLATAQFSGKVKTRGEPGGGFALAAMVTLFRNATRKKGGPGWAARRLASWFERGATT